MTYLIIVGLIFVELLLFSAGFLLGWRSGHLTGIDYALKIYLFKQVAPPIDEVTEFTKDTIKERNANLIDVKAETMAKIEEMRRSGLN